MEEKKLHKQVLELSKGAGATSKAKKSDRRSDVIPPREVGNSIRPEPVNSSEAAVAGESNKRQVMPKFDMKSLGRNISDLFRGYLNETSIKSIENVVEKIRQLVQDGVIGRLLKPSPGVSVKRQVIMTVLIPTLSIVLILALARNLKPVSKNSKKAMTAGQRSSLGFSISQIDWQIPEPYPANLRDPMQFGSVTNHQGSLTVKGILYSEDRPSAVINNLIVHIGDEVDGAEIVKINEDSVEFEMGSRRWSQQVQR